MFGPIFSTKMEEKTCKANKALFEKGALVGCNLFFSFWYWKTFCIYYHHIWQRYQSEYVSEIDQITKVLKLCGTPTNETLSKITSEEVSSVWLPSNYFEIIQDILFETWRAKNNIFQAILYIRSLPQMDKKDFQAEFPGANPQGENRLKSLYLHIITAT